MQIWKKEKKRDNNMMSGLLDSIPPPTVGLRLRYSVSRACAYAGLFGFAAMARARGKLCRRFLSELLSIWPYICDFLIQERNGWGPSQSFIEKEHGRRRSVPLTKDILRGCCTGKSVVVFQRSTVSEPM